MDAQYQTIKYFLTNQMQVSMVYTIYASLCIAGISVISLYQFIALHFLGAAFCIVTEVTDTTY